MKNILTEKPGHNVARLFTCDISDQQSFFDNGQLPGFRFKVPAFTMEVQSAERAFGCEWHISLAQDFGTDGDCLVLLLDKVEKNGG
ncbi:hypothetical protein [Bacillus sp. REN3]|uniref:hypothetical protein n=1 Tax=Bacillus sp. REN3 TaxID=2802440 RepID=UPI001AEF19B6|nr:hypothetical protein [Bacillus sp. REN3]